ncbi:N(4)-acetylcytidine aminohydrolase [Vibrio astriarenae]|uniref:N(4)-acetylcytidine aminohydrolase n=1 Tax=Vibrio astriarenae TaxID=1481923 RepID=UPI003734F4BC
MDAPTEITFFEFLTPLITAGKKTITIRDEAESHYVPGTVVDVYTLESKSHVGKIKIEAVEPLNFDDIGEFHAEQEHIPLSELKALIRDIYPNIDKLFMITFKLV